MIAAWAAGVVGGLLIAVLASRRALSAAVDLARVAGLSPFLIGVTIVGVGTDLPEIANSISAAAADRGDLIVGDATGSTATQMTFVLGVLCLLFPVRTDRRFVASSGLMMALALLAGAALLSDGVISRIDGTLLIGAWILGTAVVGATSRTRRTDQPSLFTRGIGQDVLATLGALALVGAGAVSAVFAFGQITDELGVPEYVTSFFVLSVGTSLPELLVDGRALRQGHGSLALGDILGSSLVDSTLSLGIGPLLFPVDVSSEAADGTYVVAAVVALAVLVLLARTEHRWLTGVVLIGLYAALFPLLIGA